MRLTDRFQVLLAQENKSRCPVGKIICRLRIEEPEAAQLLERVLNTPTVSIRAIKTELDQNGDRIARESISAHRNGRCDCEEES